jgi:hypothetical protein
MPTQRRTSSGQPQRPTRAETRRARAEAARAALAAAERRRRLIRTGIWTAVAVAVIAVISVVVVLLNRPGSTPAAAPTAASTAPGATAGTNPPWPAPSDASAAVRAAGLPMLGAEGTAQHIHAHLDVFANGSAVQVPADLGIDQARQQISPLHTHDTTGVIHVESPDAHATYTLGQFFAEWQVPLSADRIGGLSVDATHHLRVYVNGQLQTGDPAAIVLKAHDEIALVYGTDAQSVTVPKSYAWPAGL